MLIDDCALGCFMLHENIVSIGLPGPVNSSLLLVHCVRGTSSKLRDHTQRTVVRCAGFRPDKCSGHMTNPTRRGSDETRGDKINGGAVDMSADSPLPLTATIQICLLERKLRPLPLPLGPLRLPNPRQPIRRVQVLQAKQTVVALGRRGATILVVR